MKKLLWAFLFVMCIAPASLAADSFSSTVASQTESAETQNTRAAPAHNLTGRTYTNSIGMEFVWIPAGSFNRYVEKKSDFGEKSTVTTEMVVASPFYLGKYEVTRQQWRTVMMNNPAPYREGRNPMVYVSWYDAQEFVKRLNIREGHEKYRLPTEVEWEFAARGGTDTDYFFTKDKLMWGLCGGYNNIASQLAEYAWFGEGEGYDEHGKKTEYPGNAGGTTHPVGQKKPNQYGLYDIYGNVREWVQDSDSTSYRVNRGGSWNSDAGVCRSNSRSGNSPDDRSDKIGFRVALSPE